MEETYEAIEFIRTKGLYEVAEVKSFRGMLNSSDEEVAIEVSVYGPNKYIASATVVGDESRTTASNMEATMKQALWGIHWPELERRR